jgi:hypothetical protein
MKNRETVNQQPSFYGELKLLHDASSMTDELLEAKARYYTELVDRGQLNERQSEEVFKILDRIKLETDYRSGKYAKQLGATGLAGYDLDDFSDEVGKGWD